MCKTCVEYVADPVLDAEGVDLIVLCPYCAAMQKYERHLGTSIAADEAVCPEFDGDLDLDTELTAEDYV